MDHTEINRCLEILNKRSFTLFKKADIADKLKALDTIKQIGTPVLLHLLIVFLKEGNALLQTRAAETVLHIFSKLRSLNEYWQAAKHLEIKEADIDNYRKDFDNEPYAKWVVTVAQLTFYVHGTEGTGWFADDVHFKVTPGQTQKLTHRNYYSDISLSPDGKTGAQGAEGKASVNVWDFSNDQFSNKRVLRGNG